MCIECRRFFHTIASEWQTAFVVFHKMPWCALLTAVKNYNKSLEKLLDFFFKTETKTKTKCSRPRPRLHDPRPRPRPILSFCPRGASRPRPWSRGLHHCPAVCKKWISNYKILTKHTNTTLTLIQETQKNGDRQTNKKHK